MRFDVRHAASGASPVCLDALDASNVGFSIAGGRVRTRRGIVAVGRVTLARMALMNMCQLVCRPSRPISIETETSWSPNRE